jgi:hypothetical protein
MEWYEIFVGILAAIGGSAGLVQLIRTVRAWRDGVQQRASAPTERLVAHLERRVAVLEEKVDRDGAYISVLISELADAGIRVPARPAYGEIRP